MLYTSLFTIPILHKTYEIKIVLKDAPLRDCSSLTLRKQICIDIFSLIYGFGSLKPQKPKTL